MAELEKRRIAGWNEEEVAIFADSLRQLSDDPNWIGILITRPLDYEKFKGKTIIGTCRDCRFWDYRKGSTLISDMASKQSRHECSNDTVQTWWYGDGDGRMMTFHDDGCIHWKLKEDADV